ncbi:sensor histidine kinase [Nocardia terpenica]|nr:sensor domain-containing protein [Nocardia terpenica]
MFDFAQARRDLVYLLPGIVTAFAGFAVLTCGLAFGLGTVVVWVGVPVLVGTLLAARGFAGIERARVRAVTGREMPTPDYPRGNGRGTRWFLAVLKGSQYWRDLVHGVVALPVSVVTWSVALIWTCGAAAGLLSPIYGWMLPRYPESQGLADFIGLHGVVYTILANTAVGLVFLFTGPSVLRGLTVLQVGLARILLSDETAALRARTEQLTASRSAAVQAEAQTLRRVERDIHDGPQQRLVRLTMDLESARRRMTDNPDAARELMDEALTQSREALGELRAVSRGIAPPVLVDRGLAAALAAAAARCPVPTTLDCDLPDGSRLPESVENAAYFVVSEALTNIAKHARAAGCTVAVTTEATTLWLRVSDDGIGGAHIGKGHGLAGLADRLAAVDGRLDVHSPAGGPTVLTAEIPLPGAR